MRLTREFLTRLASDRILILDGAMGTSIHTLDLPLEDYRNLENCSEILCETRPDAIEQIHRRSSAGKLPPSPNHFRSKSALCATT